MNAADLFENTLGWLQSRYTDLRFFTERDIVWTVQLRISQEIERAGLPFRVFKDHTIFTKTRADLATLDGGSVEVAAEFKYEPSHARSAGHGGDIWPTKFDVVSWTEVEKDVQRVWRYVEGGT